MEGKDKEHISWVVSFWKSFPMSRAFLLGDLEGLGKLGEAFSFPVSRFQTGFDFSRKRLVVKRCRSVQAKQIRTHSTSCKLRAWEGVWRVEQREEGGSGTGAGSLM